MKMILMKIVTFLAPTILTAIITAIITAWIVGQPLTGLTGLSGFTHTFFSCNVPAWAFALALLGALIFGSTLLMGISKKLRKDRIHFVQDLYNNRWSIYGQHGMYVQISGTFTYDGPQGDVTILSAIVEGNSPQSMDIALLPSDGSSQHITTTSLNLCAKLPQKAEIHLWLRTRIGIYGEALKVKIVLQDNLKRDFPLGNIELPSWKS